MYSPSSLPFKAELQQIEDDTQELNFKIEELRIQKKKIAEETDNQLQEARNKLTLIKTENAGIIAEVYTTPHSRFKSSIQI